MIVDDPFLRTGEEIRPEVLRRLQRHVATVAIGFGDRGMIKGFSVASGKSAQQKAVVVILSPVPVLIMGQFEGQTDLVAGRAEFRRPVQRFEEGLFVEFGFGLDQLAIDKP